MRPRLPCHAIMIAVALLAAALHPFILARSRLNGDEGVGLCHSSLPWSALWAYPVDVSLVK